MFVFPSAITYLLYLRKIALGPMSHTIFLHRILWYYDFWQKVSICQPRSALNKKQSNIRYNRFLKSLPRLVIETYVSKLSISFYRNIVCKKLCVTRVLLRFLVFLELCPILIFELFHMLFKLQMQSLLSM